MGCESDAVSVAHRRRPTESATVVRVMRPGALGNPFGVLSKGRLVESWREACCDAFEWSFAAALDGDSMTSLADVAEAHGLPQSSVRAPYASMGWEEYADAVRLEAALLLSRVLGSERICLVCDCHPRRCHGATICGWLRQRKRP